MCNFDMIIAVNKGVSDMKKQLKIGTALLGLLVPFVLMASSVEAQEKKEIIVATDSATKPFTFKKGDDFTGYDIEVLKEAFKGSKKYKLKFVTVEFPSILSGIDSGRYHIGANNYGYSEERAAKYLFSDPIAKSNYAIATQKDDSYKTLKDLSGKKTQGMSGANYMQVLENWNKENSDKTPIDITYASGQTPFTQRLQLLENGHIDFLFYDAISLKTVIKEQGYDLKVTPLSEQVGDEKDGNDYFIYAKDKEGKALKTYVDKRLKQLAKTGKLKSLSQEFFQGDFVSDLK